MLDDSTDKVTRELVDEKVVEWRERGLDIDCVRRANRQGYKAGAMKEVGAVRLPLGAVLEAVPAPPLVPAAPSPAHLCPPPAVAVRHPPSLEPAPPPTTPLHPSQGMELLTEYAYVAVFDADFKPEPDFLERTIPYLEGNPEVGASCMRSGGSSGGSAAGECVQARTRHAACSLHACMQAGPSPLSAC